MVLSSECVENRSNFSLWLTGAARHCAGVVMFDSDRPTSIGSDSSVTVRCRVWWSMTVTVFSLATTSMAG